MTSFRNQLAGLGLGLFLGIGALVLGLASPALQTISLIGTFAVILFLAIFGAILVYREQRLRTHWNDMGSQHEGLKAVMGDQASLLSESRSHQEELAAEIMNSISGAGNISRSTWQARQSMDTFHDDFMSTSASIDDINARISSLQASISASSQATDQTASAVEEISASIQKISEEATRRYAEVKELVKISQSGQKEMALTQAAIAQVTGGIDDLKGFIRIIDDIAGRTSILSMNAAIQAAHAGEAGKGFAVVAEEIRKLAESSASNATSISKGLGSLIVVMSQAQEASIKTSKHLGLTENRVEKAADSFMEIEQSTQELAIGGKEILDAVSLLRSLHTQMDSQYSAVSTASTQMTARLEHLKSEADILKSTITCIRDDAGEVNHNSLIITQSSIAQLQLNQRMLGTLEQKDTVPTSASILVLQHAAWISRIRALLDGKIEMKADQVTDHLACDLGKWLETEGRKTLKNPTEYKEFSDLHEKIHQQARSVVSWVNKGEPTKGEEAFPQLVGDSHQLIGLITTHLPDLGRDTSIQRFLSWSDVFSVNNSQIDVQHKALVDLINDLNTSLHLGQGKHAVGLVLDQLARYTQTHFTFEEALFDASNYPDKEAHRAQHRELVAQVVDLQQNLKSGSAVLGTDTLNFLKDWLIKHIQGTDKGYSSYV